MDVIEQAPPRRQVPAAVLAGAGVLAGVVLAGGIASAQSADPSPSASSGTTTEAKPGGGRHGMGRGFGMGIHGEFTTAAPNGGYQTIATQVGEVTEVSATSLTVRSEDGYSRTYAVDDNSLVNAGNEGIGDVEDGDTVRVTALVVDGKASAVEVVDATNVEELRGRWRPRRTEATENGAN